MINVVQGLLAVAAAATISLPADTLPAPQAGQGRVIGAARQAADPVASNATVNSVRRQMVTRTEEPARVPTTADFVATDVEYYLGDDGIAYIRPGLQIKVNSIDIPTDRKPLVDVTITDDFGNPLDRSGKVTPGVISISWVLSRWDPATREYVPITRRQVTSPATSPTPNVTATQPTSDSGGKWTDLEQGHATYKFGTALPENFDRAATYTLGAYSTRNLTDIIGKNYYANPIKDFRPDGAAVTATWAKINQPTSCMNCHAALALHGGSRREVRLCVLCHAEGMSDPDTSNSIDMEVLVHKIHRGPDLANGYTIIGFGGSVHDYSHTTFPQNIRNCQNCHEGTVAAQKPAQSHNYYTEPTRDACGACHDSINWTTGAGHAAGPQANDAACSTCHQPDGPEFGPSIKGAHTISEKSSQLKGLNARIVSVSNTKPGDKPTVVFKLTNNDGSAVDGTKLTTFSPILAGPTTQLHEVLARGRPREGDFRRGHGQHDLHLRRRHSCGCKGNLRLQRRRLSQLHPEARGRRSRHHGPRGCLQSDSVRSRHRHGGDAPAHRGRPGEVQQVPRPARAPRRPADEHAGVRDLPQPDEFRCLAPPGYGGRAGVDLLSVHDSPDPHR